MKSTTTEPLWLTLTDAAMRAACSTKTLRRMIATGDLKAYRLKGQIRIRVEDLDAAFQPITSAKDALEAERLAER